MPDTKATKAGSGPEARNKFFGNDMRSKGLSQEGIKSKDPCEAISDEGAHDTAPERDNLVLKEDKGS